jgi:nicotinamidase-related amidase
VSHPSLLDLGRAALVVVDVQERLIPHIRQGDEVVSRCRRLVEGAKILAMPILVTEQYRKGLGPTVPAVAQALGDVQIIEKRTFSACGCEEFLRAAEGHDQLLLCGIEAHVCLNQTALDALAAGIQVHVARDAIGSRSEADLEIGLAKMRAAGAVITSTETALFELLRTSTHPRFKEVSALVK